MNYIKPGYPGFFFCLFFAFMQYFYKEAIGEDSLN